MGNGIAAALGVLFVIALAALIANRVPWQAKLGLILVAAGFTFFVAHKLSDFEGWPTGQPIAQEVEFLYSVAREPSDGDPGAIYVLVATDTEPRLYELPYSRGKHEQAEGANRKVKQGVRVAVGRAGGGEPGAARFYELPPPGADTKQ